MHATRSSRHPFFMRPLPLALCLSLIVAACGGSQTSPEGATAGAEAAPPEPSPELRYYWPTPAKSDPPTIEADVVVYGGSSAGVTAAVQAARMGKTAVIAAFGRNIGGLSASGLGATDFGKRASIGGVALEFYQRMGAHYGMDEPALAFEPHVAEATFNEMVEEEGVEVYYVQRLDSVEMEGDRIVALAMEDGTAYRGAMFVDATYEGDLLAMAGVTYTTGRESNDTYGEQFNGIYFGHPNHNFEVDVDPYVVEGDPSSGLVWGVTDEELGEQGEGDDRIQAYNFRMTLTRDRDNWRPIPRPHGYDADRYELLRRYIDAGVWDVLKLTTPMPGGKTDTNNWGGFSTDNIGRNHGWPEGDYETREGIFQDHVTYQMGLMWFLCHDERLPQHVRDESCAWGLPRDEYEETGGWPHELYIREGRRMVSDYVMTEHNASGAEVVGDPVALAAYGLDSHHVRRIVVDGAAKNEGNVEVEIPGPFPIGYRAIVPPDGEAENLFVPVAVSASHIAFGSIRMEPVFMALGQASGTAAALAIDGETSAQDVPYPALNERLVADGQVIAWDPSMEHEDEKPNPDTLEELEVPNPVLEPAAPRE